MKSLEAKRTMTLSEAEVLFKVDKSLFTTQLVQKTFSDSYGKQNQEITLSECANLTSRDLGRGQQERFCNYKSQRGTSFLAVTRLCKLKSM